MNKNTHNSENRLLHFAMGSAPQNNPHAQENFSENVEDMYSMQTGDGGTMDLYDKHYQAKVDTLSTEIESYISNIDTCNFDRSELLTAKKEYWTSYYTELGTWMRGQKNEQLMARETFDTGMAHAETTIAKLDAIADKAEQLATTGPTEKRETYSEKMSKHFEEEALETMEVDGQLSGDGDMFILDIPTNWHVETEGILEARPNETGNAANERAVASGRNRIYIKSDVTEFQVNTSEGSKMVSVEDMVAQTPVLKEQVNETMSEIDMPKGGSIQIKFESYTNWQTFGPRTSRMGGGRNNDFVMKKLSNGKISVNSSLKYDYVVLDAEGNKLDSSVKEKPKPVFKIRNLEKKEVLEVGADSVETAVEAVLTVETKEGEPKPKIHIEIDVENDEAHENTEELAEKDPVADNNITEATFDSIPVEDLTVTVDKEGNTINIDLENAAENLPIQASAIVDNALTKALDIGKEETTVTLDSVTDEIIIETTDDADQVLLDQTVKSLKDAGVAKVDQVEGKIIIHDAKEKAGEVVKHVRKMAKTDGSADMIHGVELPDEQKIVTEAEKKQIDKQTGIENKYLAYEALQRTLFKAVIFNPEDPTIKTPQEMGTLIVKRLYADHSGEVYLTGWNLTENEDWGIDNKMTSGIVETIKRDPAGALDKIRRIKDSTSYAESTTKLLNRANSEYSNYKMNKALTYDELKDSKHVKSVMGKVRQIGDSLRRGSADAAFVEREVSIANTMLEEFRSLQSRAGLGLALEESMLPARSEDGKTLYRFSYDSKTNTLSYTKHDVDEKGVVHEEGYLKEQEKSPAVAEKPEVTPKDNSEGLTKGFRKAMSNLDPDSQAYDGSMINALSVTMNPEGRYDLVWSIPEGDAPRYPSIQGIMEFGGVHENGAFVYKNAVESELQDYIDKIK